MKFRYKTILLSLFCFTFSLQAQITSYLEWSEPIAIADESYDNLGPQIVVAENDNSVVLWANQSTKKYYTTTWNGTHFNEPTELNTNGITPFVSSIEGATMAAFDNNVYIAWGAQTTSQGIFVNRSTDGGNTFEPPVQITPEAGRYFSLLTVSINETGNPMVSYISTTTTWLDAQYYITNSADGGQTYEMAVQANSDVAGGLVCECCPATVIANEEMQVLMFRNNNSNIRDIWASKSIDNGLSFGQAADIDDTDWQIFGCPSTGPDGVFSHDELVSVSASEGNGAMQIYMSRVNAESLELIEQKAVSVGLNQNYPHIAGEDDNMAIVWQENNGGDIDVYMTWTATGATALAQNIEIVASGEGGQKFPDITYANDIFYIVYEDVLTNKTMYRTAKVFKFGNVGVEEEAENDLFLQISPNPTSDVLQINFSETAKNDIGNIKIWNANGSLWLEENDILLENKNLTISHFPKALYFLAIEKNEKTYIRKFIVE
ncbi:MAG: T9SS type A sorting domain-containing protein [Chitinophagales bacterium]